MADDSLVKIPKFLKRLYREISDPTNEYITWSEDGERIRIVNKDLFIKNTLPILSRTKEYSTFIRQLNIYGFVKLKSERGDDIEEYFNGFFKRDQPGLMGFMKRVSKTSKTEGQLNWPAMESSINALTNSNYRLSNEVAQLKERVTKQEHTINGLFDILGRVFRSGLHNVSYDSGYNQQNIDSLFSHMLSPRVEEEKEVEQVPTKKTAGALPTKEKKTKDDKFFADMNDIFF